MPVYQVSIHVVEKIGTPLAKIFYNEESSNVQPRQASFPFFPEFGGLAWSMSRQGYYASRTPHRESFFNSPLDWAIVLP